MADASAGVRVDAAGLEYRLPVGWSGELTWTPSRSSGLRVGWSYHTASSISSGSNSGSDLHVLSVLRIDLFVVKDAAPGNFGH